jgi:uncharacterized protein
MSRAIRAALWPVLAAMLIGPAILAADVTVPYLTGRVVDDANVLSQDARDRIVAMSKAHEAATTNQVVVLTVPALGGASVEEYAVKVFEAWKLGQKDKKNGVLVVVAPKDRKMRIEVGHGLEGTLPDGASGEIIRTWMTPAFKAGNYDKGIEDGVAAIIARLEGRGGPIDRQPAAAPESSSSGGNFTPIPMPMALLVGAFIFGILGIFTVVGVMTPAIGWFLYLFLIPFWGIFPMVIIGPRRALYLLGAYLILFPIAKLRVRRQEWYTKAARELKTSGSTSLGGFTMTSGSSSSSGSSWSSSSSGSSWSSSSDSFSGGGGTSGGGGASGSW